MDGETPAPNPQDKPASSPPPPATWPTSVLARRFPGASPSLMEAIGFWERGRIAYNGIQLLLTAVLMIRQWPESRHLYLSNLPTFFFYALLANVLYTSVYLWEVFLQIPNVRPAARPIRWMILIAITAFACQLAILALQFDLLRDPARD